MERGLNVAAGSRKGARSYLRLNTLRTKLILIARRFQEAYGVACLTDVSEEQLHTFSGAMRSGALPTCWGRPYRATRDYVKIFKSFWHWHMRVARKRGEHVLDLCVDLDTSNEKPPWVYLTEPDVRVLAAMQPTSYRVLSSSFTTAASAARPNS
jgi:hypothetical protein